jgi:fumarate hydratase, class I
MVLQTLSAITSMKEALVELIKFTSSHLPKDIQDSLHAAAKAEEPNSRAVRIYDILFENIHLAEQTHSPLCQDTGTLTFYINHPRDFNLKNLKEILPKAIQEATEKSYLRPNSVDPITGKNPGNNLGQGFPFIYSSEWDKAETQITLLMKGGGCENVSFQYSIPHAPSGAERDIEGIKRAILFGIHEAQGKGCAPGVLGVGIGGDRAMSYSLAKEQLLRTLTDKNPDPQLDEMEKELVQHANKLGIGPMGLGGGTTLLGVKIGKMQRIPACFYISGAYLCWAARKHTMICHPEGNYTIG